MTEEKGTMAEHVLESLGAALKASAQVAVARLKAGDRLSLEDLYHQGEALLARISWGGAEESESVWAVRAGELTSLQGPNFSLTMTSNSLVLPELLSMVRDGAGGWIVEQDQVEPELAERLEQALARWEEGQARLNCLPAPPPRPAKFGLEAEAWMESLFEAARWAAKSADAQAPGCSGCHRPVPAQARFCPHCGKALASPTCPRCHNPLPPQARFCGACGQMVAKSL